MSDPVTISYTLQQLLTSVGSVITSMLDWLVSLFNTAVQSPIVLVFIAFAIIGVVVAFTKKLLHI